MSKRVLVLGASGQVGRALQETGPSSAVVFCRDAETDIRRAEAVSAAIGQTRPDLVVNCAAFTDVDGAEVRGEEAQQVNAAGAGVVAEACAQSRCRLIHISTDYVFDGATTAPYSQDSRPSPINVYGRTKLEGERLVLANAPRSIVVRTAWVHSAHGSNFVRTAVRALGSGIPMRVVDDQIGTPTRALHLADAIWRMTERAELEGIFHFTDAGVASWFDVAVVVADALSSAGKLKDGANVVPVNSSDVPRPASRPRFTVLDKHASWAAIGHVPQHWRFGVTASVLECLDA